MLNCSTINPFQYSVVVFKEQGFQDKHHVRTFVKFVCRKVKIMAYSIMRKIQEDMLDDATQLGNATAIIS